MLGSYHSTYGAFSKNILRRITTIYSHTAFLLLLTMMKCHIAPPDKYSFHPKGGYQNHDKSQSPKDSLIQYYILSRQYNPDITPDLAFFAIYSFVTQSLMNSSTKREATKGTKGGKNMNFLQSLFIKGLLVLSSMWVMSTK